MKTSCFLLLALIAGVTVGDIESGPLLPTVHDQSVVVPAINALGAGFNYNGCDCFGQNDYHGVFEHTDDGLGWNTEFLKLPYSGCDCGFGQTPGSTLSRPSFNGLGSTAPSFNGLGSTAPGFNGIGSQAPAAAGAIPHLPSDRPQLTNPQFNVQSRSAPASATTAFSSTDSCGCSGQANVQSRLKRNTPYFMKSSANDCNCGKKRYKKPQKVTILLVKNGHLLGQLPHTAGTGEVYGSSPAIIPPNPVVPAPYNPYRSNFRQSSFITRNRLTGWHYKK